MIPKALYGRLLTHQQLPEDCLGEAHTLESMIREKDSLICQRCHTTIKKDWLFPDGQHYCRACLVFGRNQEGRALYYFKPVKDPLEAVLTWTGTLTSYQKAVSDDLVFHYKQGKNILVHAVTGAGKTEMIYQLLAKVLEKGDRVAIVSPRIDVCQEIFQRLCCDFSCDIALLHSDSKPYDGSPLLVATTHQLLTFYQAFDLIIVDEVDAFPYVGNSMLHHALKTAQSPNGQLVYLTATSTMELDKEVKQGQLVKLDLARRFHANPLVLPKFCWQGNLQKSLARHQLPTALMMRIHKQRKTHYPLLIFFPNIDIGQEVATILQKDLPKDTVSFVSSQTEERKAIIQDFRKGKINVLVTTTILERGVTFPCVDVFVCMANHKLYTSSSLIQIGGRVGRSLERPSGEFLLFHDGKTKAMKACYQQIREMNQKGGFHGVSTM